MNEFIGSMDITAKACNLYYGDFHGQDRRTDGGAEKGLDHRNRNAQYATGDANCRQDGILPSG